MQERIVEILIYVLSEVRKTNKPIGEIDVSLLEQRGYTTSEISLAFSWLLDRVSKDVELTKVSLEQQSTSFRVLHNAERFAISPEAYGYLLQLRELNIISDIELESIIERSILSGFEQLEVPAIQSIVALVLFDAERPDFNRSGMIINSNDTIH